ncbi:MAG: hypothetical protein CL844_03880 [Crocinitomicaceae bacterium]|nr:hypothetical protein [Crocinitomicaceae bacterium]
MRLEDEREAELAAELAHELVRQLAHLVRVVVHLHVHGHLLLALRLAVRGVPLLRHDRVALDRLARLLEVVLPVDAHQLRAARVVRRHRDRQAVLGEVGVVAEEEVHQQLQQVHVRLALEVLAARVARVVEAGTLGRLDRVDADLLQAHDLLLLAHVDVVLVLVRARVVVGLHVEVDEVLLEDRVHLRGELAQLAALVLHLLDLVLDLEQLGEEVEALALLARREREVVGVQVEAAAHGAELVGVAHEVLLEPRGQRAGELVARAVGVEGRRHGHPRQRQVHAAALVLLDRVHVPARVARQRLVKAKAHPDARRVLLLAHARVVGEALVGDGELGVHELGAQLGRRAHAADDLVEPVDEVGEALLAAAVERLLAEGLEEGGVLRLEEGDLVELERRRAPLVLLLLLGLLPLGRHGAAG